jgi:TfoX/Sxy family transcriptional regulator of competence genes
MTVDELAAAVRAALSKGGTVREVKMFGGTGFMLNGNLVAAASKRGLLARVGNDREHDALQLAGTRVMEMRGRTMHGYIRVAPEALTDSALKALLRLALAFGKTLAPKTPGKKPARLKSRRASSSPGRAASRSGRRTRS